MKRQKRNTRLIFFVIFSFLAISLVLWQWHVTSAEIKKTEFLTVVTPTEKETKTKPPEQAVKAIYLTAYSAGNPKKIEEMIDLVNKTELNAVVIDIKDYSGLVLYNTKVGLANKLGLKDVRIKNLPDLIKKLHDKKIYVIARQTLFQDPILAEKRPEWALKDKNGKIWRDKMGLSWVDMTNKYVWTYNLQIAKEMADLGFDEINFDYIRFPSDGQIKNIVYDTPKKKYEIIADFFHF